MRYCITNFCWDCIDRQLASLEEEVGALSCDQNHLEMKRKLQELRQMRQRWKEEAQRMGGCLRWNRNLTESQSGRE
jgi:late competence protein required for DNA uptake (superfamily II DNA/RNA helicase)